MLMAPLNCYEKQFEFNTDNARTNGFQRECYGLHKQLHCITAGY